MKKLSLFLFGVSIAFAILLQSCKKDQENGSADTNYYGIWTRLPGPSGDRTDIAIGGIPGEPANRVYMCEKEGSLTPGFFKGTLDGDIINWDPEYNFPYSQLKIIDGELEFSYPTLSWSIPTMYERGTWGGECGNLTNTTKKLAVGLDLSDPDFSYVTILGVSIDNVPIPITLLNSVTTQPDCSSNSFVTLGNPLQSNQNGDYYVVRVTFSAEGLNGFYTQTDDFVHYKYYFADGCNSYKVIRGPLGYTIAPI